MGRPLLIEKRQMNNQEWRVDFGGLCSRAIVPIGVMFSLTLICGNLAYLTLSVSFIQMLKVRVPKRCRPLP